MDNNESEDEMHRDPKNWKWGLFYYNPDDRRLFVPKKIQPFGITVNFANPSSFLILALLILFIALATKAST